jgi:hypothetical protein
VIERLEEEKGMLIRTVEVKEQTLEKCGIQLNLLAEQKSHLQMDLGAQLQLARATIASHLPFIDSSECIEVFTEDWGLCLVCDAVSLGCSS